MPKHSAIILAAGKGSRMCSSKPKVLHELAGKSLLGRVISTAHSTCDDLVVVYGKESESICSLFSNTSCTFAFQKEQLGTGHAVKSGLPSAQGDFIIILYGDVPLIEKETINEIKQKLESVDLVFLTAVVDNPTGYGRILRNFAGNLMEIVEERDANEKQREINEVNTGVLAVRKSLLAKWLDKLNVGNTQNEYYLTDILALAVADNAKTDSVECKDISEVAGVNDLIQLAALERVFQRREAKKQCLKGVSIKDIDRVDFRGDILIGRDTQVDINVVFSGKVSIGSNCFIGAGSVISDTTIGNDVVIKPFSIVESSVIRDNTFVGPFARIRPETELGEGVHIGNFVEIKKSTVKKGTKINHLTYIGDASIGQSVNIGAGVITCNYDGVNKHKTTIEDGVFVGSGSQIVAPVTIGENATVGAGSVIVKTVPADKLSLSRSQQRTITEWSKPEKT